MENSFFEKIKEAFKTFVTVIISLTLVGASFFVLNFINCINPFFVGVRSCGYTQTTPSSYPDSYQEDDLKTY